MNLLFHVLNLAKEGKIQKIFWPSSIAVFGPTTLKEIAAESQSTFLISLFYKPDFRQKIADRWQSSIDDRRALEDWGWQHEFDLDKMTRVMLENLKNKE